MKSPMTFESLRRDPAIALNRNEARRIFADGGLDFDDVTTLSLRWLLSIIDADMQRSGLFNGSYRMRRDCKITEKCGNRSAVLRCKADYFDAREAVTFNPGGFIGFAGWADDTNVQPILRGFCIWAAELAGEKTRATASSNGPAVTMRT